MNLLVFSAKTIFQSSFTTFTGTQKALFFLVYETKTAAAISLKLNYYPSQSFIILQLIYF